VKTEKGGSFADFEKDLHRMSSIASTRVGSVKTAAEARNPSPRPFAEMLPVLGAAG
jgi:hypothetical protein